MKIVRPQQQFMLSFGFICKLHLFLFASFFFFLFNYSTAGYEPKDQKRVLIFFPGQSDPAAYPLTEKGIKSFLDAAAEFRSEYFIEYMDRYRNSDQTHYRQLLDLKRHKYSEKRSTI